MADIDPRPSARRLRGRGVHLSTVVGLVVGLLSVAFVVKALGSEWHRVRQDVANAAPGWIAAGLLFAALGMTGIAVGWTGVLEMLGSKVARSRVIAWYFVGELGKYLPGGVWPVLGRGELARRGGVPRQRAYVSVFLSLITLYLGAMFVAAVLLPFSLAGGGPLGAASLLLVLLPLGLAALHPRILNPVFGLARRVTKRELVVEIPSWRASVMVVLRYAPAWVFVGLATWAMARAIDPGAPFSRIAFAAVLSWIAGFVAVPVPAGAGVREAVFIAASGMDHGAGATVAVAARILFILVDGGGAGIGAPFLRHRQPVTEDDLLADEVPDTDAPDEVAEAVARLDQG